MGIKGIILSGHKSLGVERWGGVKWVTVENLNSGNWIGRIKTQFLNIFVFYVSISSLYDKNWVNRFEVSFLRGLPNGNDCNGSFEKYSRVIPSSEKRIFRV